MGTRKRGTGDTEREQASVRSPQSSVATTQVGDAANPSERDLAEVLRILPEAVAVCRDNAIVYANDALVELLGYRDESEVLVLEVDAQVGSSWRSWSTKERTGAVPERWRRADGTHVFVEVTLSPATRGRVLVVARDVTERWQEQVEAQQAERLVAIGTLATSIAHQINNPLAYLITNATFLHEEIPAFLDKAVTGGQVEELLRRAAELRIAASDAHEGALRVAAVVRELRALTRSADPSAVRNVDLHAVLDAACAAIDDDLRPRATLKKEYGLVPPLRADAERLEQALVNVLANAVQAVSAPSAPGDGIVTVSTRVEDDGFVVVTIRDTGPGISVADAARAFDPFFTTRPLEGAGLGLTTALAIVRGMGGRISLESAVGQGTVVTVQLPTAKSPR